VQNSEATENRLDRTPACRLNFTRRVPSLVNDHRNRRAWPAAGFAERGAFCDDRPNFMSICSGSIEPTNCLPHGELRVPEAKDPLPRAKSCSRTIRRAKGGLNSKLRAVCVGALRRSGD